MSYLILILTCMIWIDVNIKLTTATSKDKKLHTVDVEHLIKQLLSSRRFEQLADRLAEKTVKKFKEETDMISDVNQMPSVLRTNQGVSELKMNSYNTTLRYLDLIKKIKSTNDSTKPKNKKTHKKKHHKKTKETTRNIKTSINSTESTQAPSSFETRNTTVLDYEVTDTIIDKGSEDLNNENSRERITPIVNNYGIREKHAEDNESESNKIDVSVKTNEKLQTSDNSSSDETGDFSTAEVIRVLSLESHVTTPTSGKENIEKGVSIELNPEFDKVLNDDNRVGSEEYGYDSYAVNQTPKPVVRKEGEKLYTFNNAPEYSEYFSQFNINSTDNREIAMF